MYMQKQYLRAFKLKIFLTLIAILSVTLTGCSFKEAIVQKYASGDTDQWSQGGIPKTNSKHTTASSNGPVDIESYYADVTKKTGSRTSSRENGMKMGIWKDPVFQRQFMGSYGIRSDIEPEVTEIERETLARVMNLMSEENTDQARTLLETTVAPEASALFDFILGNIYFQEDNLDRAGMSFRKAVSKFPDFLRAHKNLAMVDVRNGDFENAIGSLTRTLELGEGAALTYGLLGFSYTSVEDHVNAEYAYRQAMMRQPDSMDWQLGLAQTLFKQEKYADSAALCSQMILREPDNADYWRLQANAYLGLDKPLKAAQNYEYLRTLEKADADSLNKLGDIYVKESMLDIAADVYTEALDKNTGQAPDQYIRNAKVLVNYGGMDDARKLVGKIKDSFSGMLTEEHDVDLLRLEARIALNEGANEKQADILQEIVRINPMDGEALIQLGQYFSRKDDPEKAIFYYERAEAIEGVAAKAMIRHAQLLVQESRYQNAVPLLESALRMEHRSEVAEYLTQVKAAAKSRQ